VAWTIRIRRLAVISVGFALLQSPPEEETTLANLSGIMKELSKERDLLHQQLSGLNAALEAFAGVYRGNNGIKPRRKMSAKGRASIVAAQKARWAKAKGIAEVPKKRTMSASARYSGSTAGKMGQGQAEEEDRVKQTRPSVF
jgi:hypothetical protein